MKAIITDHDISDFKLGLRLVPEGANDRLLIRMLERQYPAILRSPGEDVHVPLFEGQDNGLAEIEVSAVSCWEPFYVEVSHSSLGATIRRGQIICDEGSTWIVTGLHINGRDQQRHADGTFHMENIVAGARLRLRVEPHWEEVGVDGPLPLFRARIIPGA